MSVCRSSAYLRLQVGSLRLGEPFDLVLRPVLRLQRGAECRQLLFNLSFQLCGDARSPVPARHANVQMALSLSESAFSVSASKAATMSASNARLPRERNTYASRPAEKLSHKKRAGGQRSEDQNGVDHNRQTNHHDGSAA